LPSDNINLEVSFNSQDYLDVRAEDNIYVDQLATAEYSIFQFKEKAINGILPPQITCIAKSSLAPSESTVYLQVYNFTTSSWETLTSNSVANADTKFTLTAELTSGLSDHHDIDNWYSFRLYQLIK